MSACIFVEPEEACLVPSGVRSLKDLAIFAATAASMAQFRACASHCSRSAMPSASSLVL